MQCHAIKTEKKLSTYNRFKNNSEKNRALTHLLMRQFDRSTVVVGCRQRMTHISPTRSDHCWTCFVSLSTENY